MRIHKTIIKRALNWVGCEIRSTRHHAWGYDYIADLKQTRLPIETIFVVGAHFGVGAKLLIRAFPKAAIYCFEPYPDTYKILCDSLRKYPQVRTFNTAVGEKNGTAIMRVNRGVETNSLLPTDTRCRLAEVETLRTVEVPLITLDSFCQTQGIHRVDYIHSDVQGYELRVLKGAQGLLSEKRIGLSQSEVCFDPIYAEQSRFLDIYAYMESYTYRMLCVWGLSFEKKPYPRWGNVIFVRGDE